MKRKYLILFSLSGLVLCLDQLTKFFVRTHFQLNEEVTSVLPFVKLTYLQNNGFAFGFLKNAPTALQDIFFLAIPVFALILIVLIFIKLRDDQMGTSLALSAILGGATGNLIDRLQHGYVIDFLKVNLGGKIIGFNVADLAIMAGVVLMFITTLRQEKPVAQV